MSTGQETRGFLWMPLPVSPPAFTVSSPDARATGFILESHLRAVVLLAAEKLSELSEVVPLVAVLVSTLLVPPPHAGVIVLSRGVEG